MSDTYESKGLVETFGSTRLGRILVSVESIRNNPEAVGRITGRGAVLRAHWHQNVQEMEYLVLCPEFDELEEDEYIPLYHTTIFHDGLVVKFTRGSYKRKIKESVKEEIMKTLLENSVNFSDFKSYMIKCSPHATDEDFETYDETFLDALKIYIKRRDSDEL